LEGQQAQVERLICQTPPQTRDGALVVAATLLDAGAAADDFPDAPQPAGLVLATFTLEQASVAARVGAGRAASCAATAVGGRYILESLSPALIAAAVGVQSVA
jgi:hypothetical protein